MTDTDTSYVFVVCQAGAEKALKAELARTHPEFKFAFSRPGFVTFKRATEPQAAALAPDFELDSIFARAYGLSLSRLAPPADPAKEVIVWAKKLRAELGPKGGNGAKKPSLRLHVYERDFYAPGSEPMGFEQGQLADQAYERILKAVRAEVGEGDSKSQPLFAEDAIALEVGEPVLDVVVVEEGDWWVGWHEHSLKHHAYPGGNPRLRLPPDAPSRAYLKLEEALLWSRAPLRTGDCAVEIGSAPGGASLALLRRGINVLGIDPGEMHRVVLRSPTYRHLSKSVMFVEREELPERVDWLLLDMNAEPRVALTAVESIAHDLEENLLGILLTVKLNQWKLAEKIPGYLEALKESLGLARIRATQLAHNRQEIFVYGLTRRGMARIV
jgi:23S rRNA (cytidine2498-2'-O)-methyltransferase